MTWDPIANPIDYVLLAGKKSPGIAVVTGANSPRKLDERGGYGLSGSTVVFTGVGIAKFAVKIRLYTAEDWAAWQAWKPLVDTPPLGARPRALDIWHPLLEDRKIKSVLVEDCSQPEETDPLVYEITIDFKQFRRPKIQLAKPDAAANKPPTDPYDKFIDQLAGQVQTLARGDSAGPLPPFP